jgi:hypothetical protein
MRFMAIVSVGCRIPTEARRKECHDHRGGLGERELRSTTPQAGYLGSKNHGIGWKEGPATAKSLGKPHGQWGSKAELDFNQQSVIDEVLKAFRD